MPAQLRLEFPAEHVPGLELVVVLGGGAGLLAVRAGGHVQQRIDVQEARPWIDPGDRVRIRMHDGERRAAIEEDAPDTSTPER